MRPTKDPADDAIATFYRTLIELELDDADEPKLRIMMPVSDVRAIIRDRNVLQDHLKEPEA